MLSSRPFRKEACGANDTASSLFYSLQCFPTPCLSPAGLRHHSFSESQPSSFTLTLAVVNSCVHTCRFFLPVPLVLSNMSWQNLVLQITLSARSVAACQLGARSLLHLHSALLRGRTSNGEPAALQVATCNWCVFCRILFTLRETRTATRAGIFTKMAFLDVIFSC